jgi:hypothetical protein
MMKKDSPLSSTAPGEARSHRPIVQSLISFYGGLTERTLQISFTTAQELRTELSRRLLAGIDFVDATQQASWRLCRQLIERIDLLSAEGTREAEQLLLRCLGLLQQTGLASVEAAGQVLSATMGAQVPEVRINSAALA